MKTKSFVLVTVLLIAVCGSGFSQDFLDPPDSVPYTPLLISFAPMVSFPIGYFDVSASAAVVGAMARDVYGFMGAGVFNMARDVGGFQGAGVFNIANDVAGFQGAGVFNMAHNVAGGQGSGVFNIAGDVDGGQGAGVFNIGSRVAMFQGAGVFNIADDLAGFQGAGVFNIAGNVRGVQAAGVFNSAKHVRGVQVGLVNVADDIDGIQIGLINIARDGVNGPGAFFEPQTGYAYAYWQNGSRFLYSVISVGAPVSDCFVSADRLVTSVGIGSRMGPKHGLHLDAEILAAQDLGPALGDLGAFFESCGSVDNVIINSYPEIRLRFGLPLGRHLEAVAGITVDVNLSSAPKVPMDLRQGFTYSDTWFHESFTAYSRWFVGLKL